MVVVVISRCLCAAAGGRWTACLAALSFVWVALSSPLLFAPASLLSLSCSHLPCARPYLPLGAYVILGLDLHLQNLDLACIPPRVPEDTDTQFAHLEY
jgi:hypothetical protein